MLRFLLCILNIVFVAYVLVLTVCFELLFVFFLTFFLLARKGRLDDAARYHNGYYGAFITRLFWPAIRVRRLGFERLPTPEPVMIVTNHRSLFDILFFGLTRQPNVAVLVRSWPLRIPIVGWFMKSARYMNVDSTPYDQLAHEVRKLAPRGVSFLCFVEGHRSRDGRLQRFRSGAFRLAAECNLPVLPVCVTGTERICPPGSSLVRPALVNVEIMPQVEPSAFPEEKRALRLRRHVENLFREHLGE